MAGDAVDAAAGAPHVGVLDLQGDVREHLQAFRAAGADARPIKRPEELAGLDALAIPGGESTTIGRLMGEYGFLTAIRERHAEGMAVLGTCAGLILAATDILGSTQPRLGLIDISVRRNAFGRQRESFEVDLPVPALGPQPVRAVFIRAPYIERLGPGVECLAEVEGCPVMARSGRVLVAAFHPELTDDVRLHRYFLEEVAGRPGG